MDATTLFSRAFAIERAMKELAAEAAAKGEFTEEAQDKLAELLDELARLDGHAERL